MTAGQAVVGFSVAAGVATVTPGLDTALVLRTAAVEGTTRAMMTALGICCGALTWSLMSSVGLGALLVTSRFAFVLLQLGGAAYLIQLGVRLVFGASRAKTDRGSLDTPSSLSLGAWYLRGLT